MSDKMTQVNEFLKLMGHTGVVERLRQVGAGVAGHTVS
jgi:hypothetical protein